MAMDQVTYRRWWVLHLRVARGECLNAEDQAYYEDVRRQLEQEELLGGQGLGLRKARAAVASLEAECATLEARRQRLDADIATLEAALEKETGQPLGGEG